MFKRLTTIISLSMVLLVCWLSVSCAPARSFDSQLGSIIEPYRFSITWWEFRAIPRELGRWICGSKQTVDDKVGVVTGYFSLVERINALRSEIEAIGAGRAQGDSASLEAELDRVEAERTALDDTVARILEEQIREALAEQGIFHPVDDYIKLRVNFPPVSFELEKPPYLLVVSPRERIETIREITLRPDISLEGIEDIESQADKLGVSSLVVELGGLGATYPSLVTNDAGLRFTIDAAAEEWVHQYLTFKPLGFRYLLHLAGLSRDYEVATMDETLASMVSREIGSMVCEKYYPQCVTDSGEVTESDFDWEMREIRRAVDNYLAQGQVEQAEAFMEQERQYLASTGYDIRKLNQAYFAFHGQYADRPTSISPIGSELKELRGKYPSLRDFLNTVAVMRSHEDLMVALGEIRKE